MAINPQRMLGRLPLVIGEKRPVTRIHFPSATFEVKCVRLSDFDNTPIRRITHNGNGW